MSTTARDRRPVLVTERSRLYHDRWPGSVPAHTACNSGGAIAASAARDQYEMVPIWIALAMGREPCRKCWP